MFGSNVYLLTSDHELRTCLEGISQYVAEVAQVTFDALAANVNRVDYCHQWRLSSDLVTQYLKALRFISLPRMRRTLIDTSTVELTNASQTIAFYDKFEERLAMKSVTQEELALLREYFDLRCDLEIIERATDWPRKWVVQTERASSS
jgi:hypothetical protein